MSTADNPGPQVASVVIADRRRLFLSSLQELIGDCARLAVHASATCGFDALELILEHKPSIAVLDMAFDDLDGMGILNALERGDVETRCVFVAPAGDAELACDAIGAGAAAWVDRVASRTELRTAIWTAATGSVFISPRAQTALIAEMKRRATADPSEIDDATRQVLQMSADGLTPTEIATKLHLAPATVSGRLQAAAKRFGVRGTTAAVAQAMRQQLIR